MDTKVNKECVEIFRDVKEEKELVILDDWSAGNQTESEESEDDDSVEYKVDTTAEIESDQGDIQLEKLEPHDVVKESSSNSKVLELNNWIDDNLIYRECPVCNEKFSNYDVWKSHILKHDELFQESELMYLLRSNKTGRCKKCHQEFSCKFARYTHSATHSEDTSKLDILHTKCKICNFNSKRFIVREHILQMHPEVKNDFGTFISTTTPKCPLCANLYKRVTDLCNHFMDVHRKHYKPKLKYECQLCKRLSFSEEETFLQHLIEKHDLNSWKALNYRKILMHTECLACSKCNSIFLENNIHKLLKHFLTHDKMFNWICKFCGEKFRFKSLPYNHMCVPMLRFYGKSGQIINDAKTQSVEKIKWKIKYLQEFENHVTHVCPFCKKKFAKMLEWQRHLTADHAIDTLKGLKFKEISNDKGKLRCTICHSIVANTLEQLHEHRFLHLPYKPYICLFCSKSLNTFRIAIHHFLKRCKDHDVIPRSEIVQIQCSWCNYKKFHDLKRVSKHYKDEHNNFEDFFGNSNSSLTCKVCGKICKKNSTFRHLQYHFEEKSFKCKLCLKSFTTYKDLNSHITKLHQVRPINPKNTDKIIKKDKIKNVKKNACQISDDNFNTPVLNEYVAFINYACPECNEVMTTQEKWTTHIETQHSFFKESNLCIKEDDGTFKCLTCNLPFHKLSYLKKHKLSHMPYKSFICTICNVRSANFTHLSKHFRRTHFAHGKFKCPICSDVLKTQHARTVHLKEVHSRNELPDTVCLVCFKVFLNKSGLNKHSITHNVDRTKYSCDVCGVKMSIFARYIAHMENHKIRGEMKENVVDENILQPQSHETSANQHVPESLPKITIKRKLVRVFQIRKKKLNNNT